MKCQLHLEITARVAESFFLPPSIKVLGSLTLNLEKINFYVCKEC